MPLTFSADLIGGPIAETIEALCGRYPIAETWLLGARTHPEAPAPVTVPGLRLILFPPDAVQGLEAWVKNGLCQVPAHEFAHALMLASQLEAAGADGQQLPQYLIPELLRYRALSKAERSAHLYEPPNPIGDLVRAVRTEGLAEEGLTAYAQEDDVEFFAEAMRAYWSHEEGDPPLAHIVTRIGSSIDALYAL